MHTKITRLLLRVKIKFETCSFPILFHKRVLDELEQSVQGFYSLRTTTYFLNNKTSIFSLIETCISNSI